MIRMTKSPREQRAISLRVASMGMCARSALLLAGGCASWSSLGEPRTPLTSRFWHRPDKQDKEPGYDLYAESVAAARPGIARDAAVAARGSKPRDGEKGSPPAGKDVSHRDPRDLGRSG